MDLKMVFNSFFISKSKGTGLGLTTCKHIIEGNKGSISVFNNLEGGTTSSITLPAKLESEWCET